MSDDTPEREPLVHRTVYAIVKNKTGQIEALLLSRRDCEKVLRGPASAGGPERIEVLHNVGWPTFDQWLAQLMARGVIPRSTLDELVEASQLEPAQLEPPSACPFCELADCRCVEQ
jgi:hypothetical protein